MRKVLKGTFRRVLSTITSAAIVVSGLSVSSESVISAKAQTPGTQLSEEMIENMTSSKTVSRTSVHDPSIVYDESSGEYYIFGSHLAVSKTSDLENWTSIYHDDPDSGIFEQHYSEEFKENSNAGETVPGLESKVEVETVSVESEKNNAENIVEATTGVLTSAAEDEGEAADNEIAESEAADSENANSEAVNNESADTEDPIEATESADVSEDSEKLEKEDISSEENDLTNQDITENESVEESSEDIADSNTDNSDISEDDAKTNEEADDEIEITTAENADETTLETEDGTEYTFATYDLASWISGNTVKGNMWAPDVIYNKSMNKWCMYLSLNGPDWNSAIALLTSDNIEGPYDYVGPVVFSGFSTTDSEKSYKKTDLEFVLGEQDELPERYNKLLNMGTLPAGNWGEYLPHAIDPAVIYDDAGNLWMVYGSWSGGIYVLELDEETGLRDYSVEYPISGEGKAIMSDPYFGKKIAGGAYVSGEGPYIEKIGNYYYLFVSYGFYSPEGGYNMRIYRSDSVDGPYTDEAGKSPIFTSWVMNYDSSDSSNNRGEKIMGNYKWDTMSKAEIAQGHNSAIVTEDGKAFVIYHTKFNDGTAAHEVRVHQLFVNKNGWLVAAPYEYSGETLSYEGYPAEEIAGSYGLISHKFQVDYSDLEYVSPVDISLNADGTISGSVSGTWEADGSECTIVIDGTTYTGVFLKQNISGTNIPVMTFSAVSKDGLTIWGSGDISDEAAVALTATDKKFAAPSSTFGSIELPTEGNHGTTITWESENTKVIANDGTVTSQSEAVDVELKAIISKGDCYYIKNYRVKVKPFIQNETDSLVVGEYLTDEELDLSKQTLTVSSPFHKGTASGLNLSGGVTIEFDTTSVGSVNALAAIFSITGTSGKLYYTSGSYLGYNDGTTYYDANLNNYQLVNDYIGEKAHVAVNLTASGFKVYVNDELAYDESILNTENGAATINDQYVRVLKWLYETGDVLNFGFGSWWSDTANNTISNVKCTVGPIDKSVNLSSTDDDTEEEEDTSHADVITYTKDKVELTTTDALSTEDNPFYKKNLKKVVLKYTINMTEGTAQNGWDGIFSFYNSSTGGRVSMQTNPYLCYNSNGYIDINQPGKGGTDIAKEMVPGREYGVVFTITTDGATCSVDGNEIEMSVSGDTQDYGKILTAISEADQLTFGVGMAKTAYWNTELCTLTDIVFSSEDNQNNNQTSEDTGETDSQEGQGTSETGSTGSDNTAAGDNSDYSSQTENLISDEKTPTVDTVEENIAVSSIKLNKKSVKVGRGGTYQLKATIKPDNATNTLLTWSSSNKKIATVSKSGLVKAKKNGSCVITVATADGSFKATCKVTVKNPVKVTSVSLNKSKKTLKAGKTYTLKAKVKPTNATIKNVTWKSSNSKVAKVDSNGKITAVSKGAATITVKTKDGSYTATCKVTVK